MEAISLLLMIVIVALLLRWFFVHDKRPDERTHGFFAMIESPADKSRD